MLKAESIFGSQKNYYLREGLRMLREDI